MLGCDVNGLIRFADSRKLGGKCCAYAQLKTTFLDGRPNMALPEGRAAFKANRLLQCSSELQKTLESDRPGSPSSSERLSRICPAFGRITDTLLAVEGEQTFTVYAKSWSDALVQTSNTS